MSSTQRHISLVIFIDEIENRIVGFSLLSMIETDDHRIRSVDVYSTPLSYRLS